ncbi:MAG: c-type cytochrome domain-containing protein [Akkermansiaceae bacterium]
MFPIFEQSCLNCHNPDKTKGGLDLSSYTNTLKGGSGGKIVEPNDTGSSLLTSVMRSGELKMPPEGDAISPAQIATIKAWIEGGLLENKNSSARAAKKPAFQAGLGSAAGKKPDGPPPMPQHLLLEPVVTVTRGSAIHAMTASPWAPLLAISSLRQVILVHSDTLELVGIIPFPEGEPVSLTFTPDARYLIIGGGIAGKSGTTVTVDVTNGQRVLSAAKEFDTVLCSDIRPGFDIVATGSPSRLVKLWNTQSQELVKSIKKHTDWVTSLDISPDGILLATGDRNGGVLVWEADSGGDFHSLRAHQAAITRAVFRADSNLLGTASEDGTIRMWEMNGGTEVKKIDAHPGGVRGFDWTRDGSFVSAGRDRKVRLWKPDFSLARELGTISSLPTTATVDAEGKRSYVGDVEGNIHVIDNTSAQVVQVLNNFPPALAERIRLIDERLTSIPSSLAEAQQQLTVAEAKHQQHQASIPPAEQVLQQSRLATTQSQQKSEALQQKITSVRQTITAKKSELEATRLTTTLSQQGLDQNKQQLATVQAAGDAATIEPAIAAVREAESKYQQLLGQTQALETNLNQLSQEEQSIVTALSQADKEHQAAKAQLAAHETSLKGLRDASPAIEQSLNAARNHLAALQFEPKRLKQSKQHWIAAQTNTKALQAREQTQIQQNTFDELLAQFAEKAKLVETLAAARQQTVAQLNQPIDPKQAETAEAKNSEMEKRKALENEAELKLKELRIAEKDLIQLRSQIDQQSPGRIEILTKSQQLIEEYHRQLSAPVE